MAAEVVAGEIHVFQVLFVDELNTPIAVNDPEIDIYYFDDGGGRVDLVVDATMTAVVPAETGRYVYPFTVLATVFEDGDTLYGKMSGVNPGTGLATFVEETVNVVSPNRALGAVPVGMIASFVKNTC
jgi:hypothetical protein